MSNLEEKFQKSIEDLEHALSFEKKAMEDPFYAGGISKSFETCLEYAWKVLRVRITDEGIDAYGPKDVVKHAGRMGLIKNVEQWLDFINDRNLAVHDYIGVSDSEYLETIKAFAKEVSKIS